MKKGKSCKRGDTRYMEKDEEYDKKEYKKQFKKMKTAGVAKELKESKKEMGYSKKPKVKPTRKV